MKLMKTTFFQSIYQVIGRSNLLKKTIDGLNKLLEVRSLEVHPKGVKKRGNQIKIGDIEYKLSDFDTEKKRDA